MKPLLCLRRCTGSQMALGYVNYTNLTVAYSIDRAYN